MMCSDSEGSIIIIIIEFAAQYMHRTVNILGSGKQEQNIKHSYTA